jgi:uncharacterized membrane protein
VKKRELTFIIVALILAAVIGGFVGELIGSFLPPGAAKTLFSKSVTIGMDTMRFQLYSIGFTIGLTFKINFMSALAVLIVIVYFRWWYI